jgi:hypothetical protein
MRFQPRHYVLIAVLVGVFFFNLWRNHRAKEAATHQPVVMTAAVPAQTPAWSAFDHAASLRDAAAADFAPALTALQQAIAAAPHNPATTDVKGCSTWLNVYRNGATSTLGTGSWKQRAARHLDGCVKYHLDTSL